MFSTNCQGLTPPHKVSVNENKQIVYKMARLYTHPNKTIA